MERPLQSGMLWSFTQLTFSVFVNRRRSVAGWNLYIFVIFAIFSQRCNQMKRLCRQRDRALLSLEVFKLWTCSCIYLCGFYTSRILLICLKVQSGDCRLAGRPTCVSSTLLIIPVKMTRPSTHPEGSKMFHFCTVIFILLQFSTYLFFQVCIFFLKLQSEVLGLFPHILMRRVISITAQSNQAPKAILQVPTSDWLSQAAPNIRKNQVFKRHLEAEV